MRRRQLLLASLGAVGTLALGCGSSVPAVPKARSVPPTRTPCAPRPAASSPAALVASAASSQPAVEGVAFDELQGFCAGVPGVSGVEYAERRKLAQQALGAAGFQALVCEAGASLRFFSGVGWGLSERPLLFILPARGEPVWVAPAFEAGTLKERAGDVELLSWQEHETPWSVAARALGAKRFGRLALDPALRLFVVEGLRREFAVQAASELFEELRIVKTPAELARLRRANEATQAAISAVSRQVKPGMSESELASLLRQAQLAAGLSDPWALVLFGPNAAFPHGTSVPRALEPGDGILVDTGGALHGYCSDISRTWALGRPTPEFERAFKTVLEAQSAALAHARPGVTCGAVDAAARLVLKNAGFGGDYERLTHRLGHGIGLQMHEAPYLVRANPRVLRPGMTMSNEPGIYVPGQFGVRIEDILAITANGAEMFGKRAQSLESPFG